MIQRIQSVYLLLAAVLMGAALGSPLVSFVTPDYQNLTLTSTGLFAGVVSYPTYGIITTGLICALIAFVEIFLYKKRKLQIRLSSINYCLIVLFIVTIVAYSHAAMQKYSFMTMRVDYGCLFPFISIIFNALAKSKINKDEKLVRSLDRIR
ncbi:MAG: DUF4293 domain-containing protein [Prevotella sp.]|jgi:hypothetical protein|nr:DUF4293 domain-containing protein [Prevotella sp.]